MAPWNALNALSAFAPSATTAPSYRRAVEPHLASVRVELRLLLFAQSGWLCRCAFSTAICSFCLSVFALLCAFSTAADCFAISVFDRVCAFSTAARSLFRSVFARLCDRSIWR